MIREEALQVLGLDSHASPAEIQQALMARVAQLEQRLAAAPTQALKAKYQANLEQLEEVWSQLLGGPRVAGLSESMLHDLPRSKPSDAPSGGGPGGGMNFRPGKLLANRYEIDQQIGVGGMGVVYTAFDRNRGKDIAIKVLLPQFLSSPKARERFQQEARLASEMSHPNIATVFDVQQDGVYCFLTMELLRGQSLRTYLNHLKELRRDMEMAEALRIVDQVCQALAYAHERTVHRDIKPENIWLTDDGKTKVMDFGIALLTTNTPSLASPQAAAGTPYYMAPEQLAGQSTADGRADQYAVGVLLYEMLTGHIPTGRFDALRKVRKDVPMAVSAAVDKALATKAEDRYPDIKQFRDALFNGPRAGGRVSRTARAIAGRLVPRSRFLKRVWATGAILALVVMARLYQLGWGPFRVQVVEVPVVEPKPSNQGWTPGGVFSDCDTCPKIVVITAGSFNMGSPNSEVGRQNDEGPVHKVTFLRPFALGKTEVTQREWGACVSDGKCRATDVGCGSSRGRYYAEACRKRGEEPVTGVNWEQALGYTEWLAAKTGKPYRLPSEAEWEYAARAGSVTSRYWGNSPDPACQFANVYDTHSYSEKRYFGYPEDEKTDEEKKDTFKCDDQSRDVVKVGEFKPNAFGLYDILGNVWEWTEDCFHENYDAAPSDGSAWLSGDCSLRVFRGGSQNTSPPYVRSANRAHGPYSKSGGGLGFRVARTL